MTARIRDLWRAALSSSFYRNRFYALGLALQKGLPVLLVPIILLIFGKSVFGEYALFYGLVQICGAIVAFGLPQSLVPLWYRQPESDRFLWTVLVALTCGWALLLVPGGLLILVLAAPQFGEIGALSLAGWLVAFTLIFNLSVLATGVARARGRQQRFFWSVAAGAVILLAGFAATYLLGQHSLGALLLVQILALSTSTLILAVDELPALARLRDHHLNALMPILKASLPLYVHTFLVMYALSVDKWIVRLWFSADQFVSYVINYQMAFSILFVPTAMTFHLGPRFSELAALGDHEAVRALERRTQRLTLVLNLAAAAAIFAYAWLTGVGLTSGYWILSAGFIAHGTFLLVSSRIMANLQFKATLVISFAGALAMTGSLVIAGILGTIEIAYAAWLIYSVTELGIATWLTRREGGFTPARAQL